MGLESAFKLNLVCPSKTDKPATIFQNIISETFGYNDSSYPLNKVRCITTIKDTDKLDMKQQMYVDERTMTLFIYLY